jgi:hypothetical protein
MVAHASTPPTSPDALAAHVLIVAGMIARRLAPKSGYPFSAEELASAVVLDARWGRRYDPERMSYYPWLWATARQRAANLWRRFALERRHFAPAEDVSLLGREPGAGLDDLPAVLAALNRLAPQDREAVELRFGLNGNVPHGFHEFGQYGLSKWTAFRLTERGLDEIRRQVMSAGEYETLGHAGDARRKYAPPAARCLHCKTNRRTPNRRGLCSRCHETPGVRALYASKAPPRVDPNDPAACRHCRRRRGGPRNRWLCIPCFKDLSVRNLYPKFSRDGARTAVVTSVGEG